MYTFIKKMISKLTTFTLLDWAVFKLGLIVFGIFIGLALYDYLKEYQMGLLVICALAITNTTIKLFRK